MCVYVVHMCVDVCHRFLYVFSPVFACVSMILKCLCVHVLNGSRNVLYVVHMLSMFARCVGMCFICFCMRSFCICVITVCTVFECVRMFGICVCVA